MNDYETRRLENISRNRRLIADLGIARPATSKASSKPPPKRRKIDLPPSRTSARIASSTPISYDENALPPEPIARAEARRSTAPKRRGGAIEEEPKQPPKDIGSIRAGWTSWTPTAAAPTRNGRGTFIFAEQPSFTPNKSPEEMLREGCFGGSYFRPYYSRTLGVSVENDWKELPTEWIAGLDVATYVASPTYDVEVNKFKVSAGQSIEEWEAQGWNELEVDVRGWFQWYCRFFMGRRGRDDERQIGRWARCVGKTGRWRRTLLKKYVAAGVREVFDDGEEEREVSPIIHQTCHHWAYEVRQEALDEFWKNGT